MNLSQQEFSHKLADKTFPIKDLIQACHTPTFHHLIINYIKDMPVNLRSFQLAENFILHFRYPILYCFKPFYDKVCSNFEHYKTFQNELERIASLVNCILTKKKQEELTKTSSIQFEHFHELLFFKICLKNVSEYTVTRFRIEPKTPKQQQFINDVEYIRNFIDLKNSQSSLKFISISIPMDSIRQKVSAEKDHFKAHYLNQMLLILEKTYNLRKMTIQNQVQVNVMPTKELPKNENHWNGKVTTTCPPVFRAEKLPTVYLLLDNYKCPVPNPDCFNRLFKNWDVVVSLDKEAVDKIPTGKTLDVNASIIKLEKSEVRYFVNHKTKRLISNLEKSRWFGFKEKVEELNKVYLEQIEKGPDLEAFSVLEIH